MKPLRRQNIVDITANTFSYTIMHNVFYLPPHYNGYTLGLDWWILPNIYWLWI